MLKTPHHQPPPSLRPPAPDLTSYVPFPPVGIGLDLLTMENGDPLPGRWSTQGHPTPPPPEDFGIPGKLEAPPMGPEPMATRQDAWDSLGSNSYLAPSPQGLSDSISSGAGSPAMPGTPTRVSLPKAVAEVQGAR